jgi:hypothetical protein
VLEAAIISRAAGRIAEHLVSLGHGAEPARRGGIARPGIRMLDPGPAPPGLRDLLRGGLPGHPEKLVKIRDRPALIRSSHDVTFPPARYGYM